MFGLFEEVKNAHTEAEIIAASQKVACYYIQEDNTLYSQSKLKLKKESIVSIIDYLNIYLRMHNIDLLLNTKSLVALLSLFSVLYNSTYDPNQRNLNQELRTAVSISLPILPNIKVLEPNLAKVGVPHSLIDPLRSIAYSTALFSTYEKLYETKYSSFQDKISRYSFSVISGIATYYAQKFVNKHCGLYFGTLINTGICALIAPLNNCIARRGIKKTIFNFYERIIKVDNNNNCDELDFDVDVPSALSCPICHFLLKKPYVAGGHIYCQNCIESWLKSSSIDPVTGNPLDFDSIHPTKMMESLSEKYLSLKLKEKQN